MCGICGVVSQSAPDPDIVRRMMTRLAHRGPDGSGYFRDAHAALGHTRLSIIDTEGGSQPLANEDNSLWISFNGEIFNYVELAAELRALGHRFRTASDTEVIVHAWEEWGERCFDRFNGQWAFALWDRRRRELILSRDRMGIRPLYYTASGERFLFASEVKALFADTRVERAFDMTGLGETFTFWSTVAPRTIFRGVYQLEPGTYAVLTISELWNAHQTGAPHGSPIRTKPYWRLTFPPSSEVDGSRVAETGSVLREKLVNASRLRFLRSDVPVGAYLSGGIDSSVTAAIIARYTNTPLRTFSLRFSDNEFDESHYQEQMARRLGTEHSSIVVSPSDISAAFPDTVWHAEAPILRAAPAPLFLLSRLVRDAGFKVVVTGEGADEVLAGYDIFREMKVRLFWSRNPDSVKRAQAVQLLYPWMKRSPVQMPSIARAFFGRNLSAIDPALSHRPRWDATAAVMGLMTADARSAAQAVRVDEEVMARIPSYSQNWDPLSRAQWLEMTTLLPGYILSSQGDRMLMSHSVEGRFPFLDRDVVEFANSLPARHKLMGLDEKHILKRAFQDLLPESILNRPKQPYRAPDAASFFVGNTVNPTHRDSGRTGSDWVAEVSAPELLSEAGIFAPSAVAALFAKCAKVEGIGMSNTDNMRVLGVLSTMLVYKQFIAGDASGGHAGGQQVPMKVIDLVRAPDSMRRSEYA